MFELFDHTADLGLLVRAATREQLLVDAAEGLRAMILAPSEPLSNQHHRSVQVAAPDIESLLFDWLSELLFLFETEHFLAAQIDLTLSEANNNSLDLQAQLSGEVVDPSSRPLEHEVKAITYHQFQVTQDRSPKGSLDRSVWEATVIVDI